MKKPFHILIIEDNPDDSADIRQMLLRGSDVHYRFTEASTGAAGLRACRESGDAAPDLVLLDFYVPDLDANLILAELRGEAALTPFPVVVLTGSDNISGADVLRMGAQDYIGKSWATPASLTHTIENAVERFRLATERGHVDDELRESREFTRRVLDNLFAFVGVLTVDGTLIEVNRAPLDAAGIPSREVLGKKFWDCSWWSYSPEVQARLRAACESAVAGAVVRYDVPVRMVGETTLWIDFQLAPLRDTEGRITHLIPSGMDITERKRSEETLRQNAALFARLVEQAPTGMYVIDADFRMQQVNALAAPVFAKVDRLIGSDFLGVMEVLWGTQVGAEVARIFRHTLDTGERYVSPSFTKQRHDIGGEESYEWEIQRVTLADGRYGVACYFHNVTVRNRAEQAIQEGEARLRLATEATTVGIWEWNVITNEMRWDAQLFRIYGIAPTADRFVQYSDWSGALLVEDLPESERILQDTVRRCGESRREFRILRRNDGECRVIEAVETVRTNEHGQAEWVVGTNLDITERKRAELEVKQLHETLERGIAERTADLSEAYEFNHQIISSAQEGIIVCDRVGRILVWNPFLVQMSGIAAGQVTGKPVTGVVPFLPQEALEQCLERALKGEVVDAPDMPYSVSETGVTHWCAARFASLRDVESDITGVIITIRDISERKQADALLAAAATRLRELTAHLIRVREEEGKRIAREIHDELGGLLTAIQANVSVAIDREERGGGKAGAELNRATKMLDSAADTVRRIIADLRPSVLDQLGIWAALEWHVGEIAKSAGLATEIVIDDDAAAIELDSERSTALFRIVQETLTNVVRHAAATQVAIRAWHDGDAVVVEIEDNGIGIAEAQLNKTGKWGLLGMQERVHNFGGTFSIARGRAHGTVAVVRMPLQQPSKRRAAIADDLRS